MPRRIVRVKVDFLMVLDDERDGLPFVNASPDWILNGFKTVKGLTEILPGAKFDVSLTRESWTAMRRRDRERAQIAKQASKGVRP